MIFTGYLAQERAAEIVRQMCGEQVGLVVGERDGPLAAEGNVAYCILEIAAFGTL